MNSGQYDEAERRFQQVLLLDPYNADASTLLRSVDKARNDVAMGGFHHSVTNCIRPRPTKTTESLAAKRAASRESCGN